VTRVLELPGLFPQRPDTLSLGHLGVVEH